jgi:cysteinyl-tRNA synthetase
MYVCGMTVYDLCHIGHARMMWRLTWCSAGCGQRLRVTYVRNITDIDDKIIAARWKTAKPSGAHRRMIAAMHEDFDALGIERPTTSRAPPNTCRRCWLIDRSC